MGLEAIIANVRTLKLSAASLLLCALACGDGRSNAAGLKAVQVASTSGSSGGPSTATAGGAAGGPASGGGGAGQVCGDRVLEPAACQSCVELACCQALLSCGLGSTCGDLRACLDACSSASCNDSCVQKHAGGGEALFELNDCIDSQCNQPCFGWPVCSSGYKADSKECAACLAANCCGPFSSCQAQSTCQKCLAGDAQACDQTTLDEAAVQCRASMCSEPCGSA